MSNFELQASSGVTVSANSKTLVGAKREATAWACFGAGDIYIIENGNTVCVRRFWQNGNSFGWDKWENV